MRHHLLGFRLGALALGASAMTLLGCATVRPSPHSKPDTAAACADWRWIAITRSGGSACPVIPGWRAQPLFDKQPAEQEASRAPERQYAKAAAPPRSATAAIADELSRFCVYEPEGGTRSRRFPPSANHELVRFDQDCAALGIAGGSPAPLSPSVWKPAAELFLSQAGKPETPLVIKNERGVRLAFLDTQPTGIGVPHEPGYSLHGYTLAHIARHLLCSPESGERCAAEITTRLALPITGFDARDRARTGIDRTHGGHVGMQSDLAGAITSEVDAWRRELSGGRAPRHLVLNLSLAWDPLLFSGLDEAQIAELHAGSQAIYRALQYASSLDVLVLAAAGNKKECPGVATDGPLLPAAWERGGPREESCGSARTPGATPLVYAVGGLGSDGEPLWNAREHSMPRRAAYGANAVVATFDPERPTAMSTGSSVATAVASSIAALVWDTVPGLSPAQVVKLLDTGIPSGLLTRRADFWFGSGGATAASPSAPPISRLSLCAAVTAACAQPGATDCPLPPAAGCQAWSPTTTTIPGLVDEHLLGGTCQPWIFPQPEDPPCPNCIKEPPPR